MDLLRLKQWLLVAARRGAAALGPRAFVALLLLTTAGAQTAYASLSVTPNTFNVIGLDSNDVTAGPNVYPVGVLVCNTGGAPVDNVVGTFFWDSVQANITLTGLNPVGVGTLAPGACTNIFFNVQVTRSTTSYNKARRYHIEVTANGEPTRSTPTPRELYVEKLVSQNRNSTLTVTGPTSIILGQTYTYTVDAKTATGGYEQLEYFLSFPNTVFQVVSIASTYTAPPGGTNDKIYADACGWENNPLSANYRSCVGPENFLGGKAGGVLHTVYTVKVVGSGAFSLGSMIYDFSGSSYHYGDDYNPAEVAGTALKPPQIPLTKSVNPGGTQLPGTDLTYTINYNNTGDIAARQFVLHDPVPDNTDFKLGSITTTLGSLSGVTVEYSADNVNWSTTPPPLAGGEPPGYNRNVRFIRLTFSGQLNPASSGSFSFTVRIR